VLDALARALRLDVKAAEYLHQLASPPPTGATMRTLRSPPTARTS